MRVMIITSCTGEKKYKPVNQLSLNDFRQGPIYVESRQEELKKYMTRAGELYTGDQHVRLMRGVEEARSKGVEVTLRILSAGYGLIPEDRLIAPYESTFATMKSRELKEWAHRLNVPDDFRTLMDKSYDLGLILLGDNYLRACMLNVAVKLGGPTLLFGGEGPVNKLPRIPNLQVVVLSIPEAKRFSCGMIGLKGEVAARLLRKLSVEPGLLKGLDSPGILDLLDDKKSGKLDDRKPTLRFLFK